MKNTSSLEQILAHGWLNFFNLLSEDIYLKSSERNQISEQPLRPIDFDALECWTSSQEISPVEVTSKGELLSAANDSCEHSVRKERSA